MTGGASPTPFARNAVTWCFLGYALFLPITIVLSEPLAYAMVPFVAWLWWRRDSPASWVSPALGPMLVFVALAVFSACVGVRPHLSLHKLDRLLLLAVVVALPLLCASGDGREAGLVRRVVALLLLGAALQAAWDVVRIPVQYVHATRAFDEMVAAGTAPRGVLRPTIYDMGNMRDPQIYMVALCVAIGLLLHRGTWVRQRWVGWAVAFTAVALVLHFKRGAWIAFLLACVFMAVLSGRRRLLLILLLGALAATAFPQVRHRLGMLPEEFRVKSAGRYALWTRVAPELIRQHPLGMGWRATQHEDFTGFGVPVQRKLNHLHNNILEVALETGWAGAVAWLAWMGTAFVALWRGYRLACGREPEWAGIALGAFGGFLALMFNGMVEYNFGDAEIFMLLNLLLALSGAIWLLRTPAGRATPAAATPAGPPAT